MPFDPKQQISEDALAKSRERSRYNLDFGDNGNVRQDFEGMVSEVASMAAKKWGRMARGDGFHSDAQVANASACALRSVIEGFYLKPPRKKHWADGRYITLTDRGVHPGADALEYSTHGARYHSDNDGITQDDQSPEEAVTLAQDTTKQSFVPVKHKIEIKWQDVQKANLLGYDQFELMGELLRRQHMFDLNNLIRRGNANHNVSGIVNHPGIRRRVATSDWGASAPATVYDEYNAAIRQMYGSETEEDVPQHSVLPRIQYNYFATEQFSAATDTKLKQFIEGAYADEDVPHTILPDPGMATASSLGGPAALFYSNDPALVRCTMPYYMRMLEPFDESRYIISIEIISRFAGVQVFDVDTVLVVDGDAAGWETPTA